MTTITDILTQFPNCRVTISSRPPRKKPQVGDVKILKSGQRLFRLQRPAYENGRLIGYQVRNGRYLYDWVKEQHLEESDRLMLVGKGVLEPKSC